MNISQNHHSYISFWTSWSNVFFPSYILSGLSCAVKSVILFSICNFDVNNSRLFLKIVLENRQNVLVTVQLRLQWHAHMCRVVAVAWVRNFTNEEIYVDYTSARPLNKKYVAKSQFSWKTYINIFEHKI